MDSFTAVENLGHPGSRPTEEASYRFLCCLCSQSIPLYGLTSFSVSLALLNNIHFYCHRCTQSGSSGESSHTQHWWSERKWKQQTWTLSRDSRSSHYGM